MRKLLHEYPQRSHLSQYASVIWQTEQGYLEFWLYERPGQLIVSGAISPNPPEISAVNRMRVWRGRPGDRLLDEIPVKTWEEGWAMMRCNPEELLMEGLL